VFIIIVPKPMILVNVLKYFLTIFDGFTFSSEGWKTNLIDHQ